MNEALHMEVLGGLRITYNGVVVRGFISAKAPALLVYLAVTGRSHLRDSLTGLLWGDSPQADADIGLRVVLSNLRKRVPEYLVITRDTVAFNHAASYSLDVERFEMLLHAHAPVLDVGRLQQAVARYHGDFLAGFAVRGAPEFDAWAAGQRERLRHRAMYALHHLAVHHMAHHHGAAGIDALTRLLHLDPWREEAHRQLMLLLAQNGQPEAALAQYERCRRLLREELDIAPAEETTTLYEQIRARKIAMRASSYHISPHQVPMPPTALLGRESEQAQLVTLLQHPACRLVVDH